MIKHKANATHRRHIYRMMLNFQGGTSFREFINAMERDATNAIDPLKFKGDCLEIFAELFFNQFQNDPSVGLMNYEPVDIEDDYGVDATGFNADNRKVAVQVKYRSNPQELVLYEEIAKTFASGELLMDLDLKHKQSVYIFTTAIGVTPACKKVFGNRLVMINIDIIKQFVDNNANFWKQAYMEVYNYPN